MKNRALILDYDGLICDTEWPMFEIWRALYAEHNAELTVETWLLAVGAVNGLDPRSHLESLIGRALDWESLDRGIDLRIRSAVAKLRPLPGVLQLMQAGREAGWKIGVASNSGTEWVNEGLDRLGLLPLVDAMHTKMDVPNPKPAPDVYLAVLDTLDADVKNSVAFEDSAPGIAAAKAAGLFVTAVPNALTRYQDLSLADQQLFSLLDAIPMVAGEG